MKKGEKKKNKITTQDIEKITEHLQTIQYGSLTLIVQDGKLVQIDRSEKERII